MELLAIGALLVFVLWKGSAALSRAAKEHAEKPRKPSSKPLPPYRPPTKRQQAAELALRYAEYCAAVDAMPLDDDEKQALKDTARADMLADAERMR